MNKKKSIVALVLLFILLLVVGGCIKAAEDSSSSENQKDIDDAQKELEEAQKKLAEAEKKAAEATSSESSSSSSASAPAPAPRQRVSINEVALAKDFTFDSFPVHETLDLEENRKYTVRFTADQPIQFVVYSQRRFDEWKKNGAHTISKVTTKSGPKCCDTSGEYSFEVNSGEAGKFYFVFDDVRLPDTEPRPATGTLEVTLQSSI